MQSYYSSFNDPFTYTSSTTQVQLRFTSNSKFYGLDQGFTAKFYGLDGRLQIISKFLKLQNNRNCCKLFFKTTYW